MTKAPAAHAERRTALLDAMAAHLLTHGLAGSPLRALAQAAGTSDRMLLYYFADKDDLLTALLGHVAAQLSAMLAVGDDGARHSPAAMLSRLWVMARTPEVRPYMLLFLDLSAAAGRGEEPHRTAAGAIAESFATWVAARLDVGEDHVEASAWGVMATLDGLFLLHAAGREAEADKAAGDVHGISQER